MSQNFTGVNANHPANGPLTVERIEHVIEALESSLKYRNGSSMDHVLADAVKGLRDLRESREAVPVALDDLLSMAASAIEDLLEHTDPHTSYYSGVWADVPGKLRAAALQESPKGARAPQNCSSSAKVQEQSGTSHAPDPVQSVDHVDGESLSGIQTSSALASLSKNTESLCGNSPVTPDGWIKCSERMPEDEQEVLTRNRMGHCFVSFFDEHSGLFFDRVDVAAACCIEHILVTHWMPLPAAPQQDVRLALEIGMSRYAGAMQKLVDSSD